MVASLAAKWASILLFSDAGLSVATPSWWATTCILGGWRWGIYDAVQRWGTNVVGSIVTDPNYGKLLCVPFDADAGPDEGHLSVGDSGGAVFVFNGNGQQMGARRN